MAKVRFEKEWRIWASIGALLVLVVGYLYMASRPPTEGGEHLWKVTKVVDAQDLTLKGSGNTIHFKLAGMRIPTSQTEAAKDFLTKTLDTKWVRVKTLREVPGGVKEGLVFLSGEDINARLIRLGMAEIDREESGFDIRPYIELEQEASREKKGLWR
jgi:endonuclease YncB( thermonuclease family)